MNSSLFKVVDSKSRSIVAFNKCFSVAQEIAKRHNDDPRNVSTYKVLAQ
jgi:hypothetical protein